MGLALPMFHPSSVVRLVASSQTGWPSVAPMVVHALPAQSRGIWCNLQRVIGGRNRTHRQRCGGHSSLATEHIEWRRPSPIDVRALQSQRGNSQDNNRDSRMTRILLPSAVLLLLSCVWPAMADPPSIGQFRAGMETNYAAMNDHEFVYHLKTKNAEGQDKESTRTYRIHIPEEGHPWQYLVSKSKSPLDDEVETDRFAVFNGKHTWAFLRTPLREGDWSRCVKIAGFSWDMHIEDFVQQLLTKSIVGMSFTTLTPHAYEEFWEQKKDKFEYQGQRTLGGHDVFIFKSDFGSNIWEFHMTAPPHSMSVLVKKTRTLDKEVLELVEIEEIGQADGFVYPRKGQWFRAPSDPIPNAKVEREPDGLELSFDIFEVRHLGSVSQEDWFPKIPPGTTIVNHITGNNTAVPWSSRQRQLIAKQAEGVVPPVVSPVSRSYGTFLNIAAIAGLAIVIIVLLLVRKRGEASGAD